MFANFLSCLKVVKDPLEAQEGRWDFSRDSAAEKGLISCAGQNLLFFPELRRKLEFPLELWQELQGHPRMGSGKSSLHASC